MLEKLRARRQSEEGFTLIELMVVVLIIAILLAIAIPTFLGARSKAQDRAAQSNLRNAFTADKTYYVDNQAYAANAVAATALASIEPSLKFDASANQVPTVNGQIEYNVDASGVLTLGSKSASGTCFYLQDNPVGTGNGTQYAKAGTCVAPGSAGSFGPSW